MDLRPLAISIIDAACKELNEAVRIKDAEAVYRLDNLISYLSKHFGLTEDDMPSADEKHWKEIKILKAGYRRSMLKKKPKQDFHS